MVTRKTTEVNATLRIYLKTNDWSKYQTLNTKVFISIADFVSTDT